LPNIDKVNVGEGKAQDGFIDKADRKRVANLIISSILEAEPTKSLPSHCHLKFSLELHQIFKKVDPSAFFTTYAKVDKFNRKRNLGGPLYVAYLKKRAELRGANVLPKSSRSSSRDSRSSTQSVVDEDYIPVENQEVQDKLNFLKNTIQPWSVVLSNWKAAVNARKRELERNLTIFQYFDTYPALKTSEGYRLLLEDFTIFHEGKEDKFFSSFIQAQDKIIEISEKKCNKVVDKEVKSIIEQLVALRKGADLEAKTNAAILLLPFLVPLPSSRKKGAKFWRPSTIEVRDSFITLVPSDTDIPTAVKEKKEKLSQLDFRHHCLSQTSKVDQDRFLLKYMGRYSRTSKTKAV
ncbi:hypothetical protein PPYR_01567, partial [Photinus pyralis]